MGMNRERNSDKTASGQTGRQDVQAEFDGFNLQGGMEEIPAEIRERAARVLKYWKRNS
jgi:hypothetical protein